MKKLTRREKQNEQDHLWGVDAICKTAVILISIVLILPILLMIGEYFSSKPSSLLHNMIKNH
jgi:hypothetical protein